MCIIYVTEHFTFRNVAKINVNIDSEKNGRGKDCQEYLQINYNKNEEDKSIIVRKKSTQAKQLNQTRAKQLNQTQTKQLSQTRAIKWNRLGANKIKSQEIRLHTPLI